MFKEFVLEIVLNDISTELKTQEKYKYYTFKHDYEMQHARLVTELTSILDPAKETIEPCITINEKVFGNRYGSCFRMTSNKFYTWSGDVDTGSITVYFSDEYHDKLIAYGYTEEEVKYIEKIRDVLKEYTF